MKLSLRIISAHTYDGVVSLIRHADSIWIFGPGEAKEELEKHLERDQLGTHIIGIETVDRMTDRQIAAKVRQHYQKRRKVLDNRDWGGSK